MRDALETLGTILDGDEGRDAVHVAVIAMRAHAQLQPGQKVGVGHTTTTGGTTAILDPVGIVDPFLTHVVEEGEWFWMFVYPRTITEMRHHWEHPDIPSDSQREATRDTLKKMRGGEASERFLRDWAQREGWDYDRMIRDAEHWVRYGMTVSTGNIEIGLPGDFWKHYEKVTGENVPDERRSSFYRCAC